MKGVTGPTDQEFLAASLDLLSVIDTWMQEDPTGKHIADPAERVRYFTSLYGEYLKPAWRTWRARLGQPVVDSPALPL